MLSTTLLSDDNVWAAMLAAKFAQAIGHPAGNYWEPGIARALARNVREGKRDRDQVELLMALQLGIAEARRDGSVRYEDETWTAQ